MVKHFVGLISVSNDCFHGGECGRVVWSGADSRGHNIEYTIRVGTRDPGGDVRRGTHDSWPPTRKNIIEHETKK